MSETLPKTLNCPACGAPLDFDGRSAIVRCKFCHNVSLVPGVLPTPVAAPGQSLDEIRRLAESGNMLEAVRMYREMFETGLKEAKDAVEALQAGRLVEPGVPAAAAARTQADLEAVLSEVRELLASGDKIAAIKRYRETWDVSLARAKYAIEQIEAGQPFQPGDDRVVQPDAVIPAVAVATIPAASGAWLGCAITGVILLFVGGILAFVLSQPGGPFVPLLIPNGPALLLPAQTGAAMDVAAVFYDPNAETRLLGLLDGSEGRMLWRSEPMPGDGYGDGLAAGDGLLYAANGSALLAYRLEDGSLAWQSSMPDRLSYGGDNLLVAGGRVLTSNLDQSVQAYDTLTGTLAWSLRLSGYDRNLRMADGLVVIFDYAGEPYTYSMLFLDPADGGVERIITPACPYSEYSSATADPDTGLFFDEAENAIFIFFDSSPGCVQRLDLSTGDVVWQTLDEDWYSFSPYGFNGLMAGSRIYFANTNELLAVDTASGGLQTLLSDSDYEFVPLAVMDETLIVRARRTRGTERFELWGLDPVSGALLWQLDLGVSGPLDPPDETSGLVDEDEPAWTWAEAGGNLLLVEFQAGPNQALARTLDPATGVVLAGTTSALTKVSGDFYSVPNLIGWRDGQLTFSLETKIYTLDVPTGEFIFISR